MFSSQSTCQPPLMPCVDGIASKARQVPLPLFSIPFTPIAYHPSCRTSMASLASRRKRVRCPIPFVSNPFVPIVSHPPSHTSMALLASRRRRVRCPFPCSPILSLLLPWHRVEGASGDSNPIALALFPTLSIHPSCLTSMAVKASRRRRVTVFSCVQKPIEPL